MKSQTDKLYNLLKDGESHRTDEIMKKVYGNDHLGLARVGARIYDIKVKYGVRINGWKDENKPSLYWYQLVLENDIDKLFKALPPVFSTAYVELATCYRKYQRAKTENDKKRLVNIFMNMYKNFDSPRGNPN